MISRFAFVTCDLAGFGCFRRFHVQIWNTGGRRVGRGGIAISPSDAEVLGKAAAVGWKVLEDGRNACPACARISPAAVRALLTASGFLLPPAPAIEAVR